MYYMTANANGRIRMYFAKYLIGLFVLIGFFLMINEKIDQDIAAVEKKEASIAKSLEVACSLHNG